MKILMESFNKFLKEDKIDEMNFNPIMDGTNESCPFVSRSYPCWSIWNALDKRA